MVVVCVKGVKGIGNASIWHRFSFRFLWGKNKDHSTRHFLSTFRQCSNALMPFSWPQCHHQREHQETHHASLSAGPRPIPPSLYHTLVESSGTNSATLVNIILVSQTLPQRLMDVPSSIIKTCCSLT